MKIVVPLGLVFFLALAACGSEDEDATGTYVLDLADARAKVSKQMDEKLAFMRGQLDSMKSVAEMGRETAEDKENWEPDPEIVDKLKEYEQQIAAEEERFSEIQQSYEGDASIHAFELVLAAEGKFKSAGRTEDGPTTATGTWTLSCGRLTLVTSEEDGTQLDESKTAALVYRDGVIELQREQEPFPVLLRRK